MEFKAYTKDSIDEKIGNNDVSKDLREAYKLAKAIAKLPVEADQELARVVQSCNDFVERYRTAQADFTADQIQDIGSVDTNDQRKSSSSRVDDLSQQNFQDNDYSDNAKKLHKRFYKAESAKKFDISSDVKKDTRRLSTFQRIEIHAKIKFMGFVGTFSPDLYKNDVIDLRKNLTVDDYLSSREFGGSESKKALAEQAAIMTKLEEVQVEKGLSNEEINRCIVFKDDSGDFQVAVPMKDAIGLTSHTWEQEEGKHSIDYADCLEFKNKDGKWVKLQFVFDGTGHKADAERARGCKYKYRASLGNFCSKLYSAEAVEKNIKNCAKGVAGGGDLFSGIVTVDNKTFSLKCPDDSDCTAFTISSDDNGEVSCRALMTEQTHNNTEETNINENEYTVCTSDGVVEPHVNQMLRKIAEKLIEQNKIDDKTLADFHGDAGKLIPDESKIKKGVINDLAAPMGSLIQYLSNFSPEDQELIKDAFGIDGDIVDVPFEEKYKKKDIEGLAQFAEEDKGKIKLTVEGKNRLIEIKNQKDELKKTNQSDNLNKYFDMKVHGKILGSQYRRDLLPVIAEKIYTEEIEDEVKKKVEEAQANVQVKKVYILTQALAEALPLVDDINDLDEIVTKIEEITEFKNSKENLDKSLTELRNARLELRKAKMDPKKHLTHCQKKLEQISEKLEKDRRTPFLLKVLSGTLLTKNEINSLKAEQTRLGKSIETQEKDFKDSETKGDEEYETLEAKVQKTQKQVEEDLKDFNFEGLIINETQLDTYAARQHEEITHDSLVALSKKEKTAALSELISHPTNDVVLNKQQENLLKKAEKGHGHLNEDELKTLANICVEQGRIHLTDVSPSEFLKKDEEDIVNILTKADSVKLILKRDKNNITATCIEKYLPEKLTGKLQQENGISEKSIEESLVKLSKESWENYKALVGDKEGVRELKSGIAGVSTYPGDVEDDLGISIAKKSK